MATAEYDSVATGGSGTRRYHSPRRRMQADQTRAAVLEAATGVVRRARLGGHRHEGVARAAAVSVERVYATFGSKAQLLKSALEVAIVGEMHRAAGGPARYAGHRYRPHDSRPRRGDRADGRRWSTSAPTADRGDPPRCDGGRHARGGARRIGRATQALGRRPREPDDGPRPRSGPGRRTVGAVRRPGLRPARGRMRMEPRPLSSPG